MRHERSQTPSDMAPKTFLEPREAYLPKPVPIGGDIMSVMVSLAACSILAVFLCKYLQILLILTLKTDTHDGIVQRITAVRSWSRLPFVAWRKSLELMRGYGSIF